MLYSGSGILIYFSLSIFSILLPIDVKAELASPILGEVTQDIPSDLINIDVPDEDEADEDELGDYETEICPENTAAKKEPVKPFISFLDTTQKSISSRVESLAQQMDSFFTPTGENYDASGSYLRLRHNAISREGGIVDYTTDVRFKLRLPNTEKKLKLFFETSSEKDPDYLSTNVENIPTTEVKDGDSVLGVQFDSGSKYGWKFKPKAGIHFGSDTETFVKFKLYREKEFIKWSYKWHEILQWYDSIGWGVDSYLELNRKIGGSNLFRSSTFARWQNVTDQFELSQVFSIFHILNEKRKITYYTGAYGLSEPEVHATHYLLGAIYRANIYKDYFFVEVEPQVKYQEINDFDAEHSLTLRLEVLFKK